MHQKTATAIMPAATAESSVAFRPIPKTSREAYSVCLEEALLYVRNRAVKRPPHYILHGTFCCSTLLSRYLEEHGHYFVLREPAILAQVAFLYLKHGETNKPDGVSLMPVDDYFHMCMKLPGLRGHFPLCGEGSTNGQKTSSCLPLGVPG
jgi:hypothetical protein